MGLPTDTNGDGTISNMAIVSHIDDDLLFINPDIRNSIRSGGAHTTVYVTAGDAGNNAAYWQGREAGAKAAYAEMAGASDWVDETVTLAAGGRSFNIASSYLASQPQVRLYFLRVPDGGGGGGFGSQGYQSLQKLWRAEIDTMSSTDGQNSYSRQDLVRVIAALIGEEAADRVMMQDHESQFMNQDHSDHINASYFADAGAAMAGMDADGYIGYGSGSLAANVSAADFIGARAALREYVVHNSALDLGRDSNGIPILRSEYEGWLQRQYYTDDFLYKPASTWSRDRDMRAVGDVNGDGKADFAAFSDYGVDITASRSEGYRPEVRWVEDYSYYNGGWRMNRHDRVIADVNGDGRDDVVGFGENAVIVGVSTGSGFQGFSAWSGEFASNTGWNPSRHVRMVADVNGDGRDDLVGFGETGVRVALSTGTGFAASQNWISDYSVQNGGWEVWAYERTLADVNGDGRADIIGFGYSATLVSLSTGTGFQGAQVWTNQFSRGAGWQVGQHERVVADVNGDGRADVVGFGDNGVLVSLSTGTGFAAAVLWSADFGSNTGWSAARHDRMLADLNGDGRADIVAWGDNGMRVALSDGDSFNEVDPELFYVTNGNTTDPLLMV